jgi:hypothetical protein
MGRIVGVSRSKEHLMTTTHGAYFITTDEDTFEPTALAGGHWGESLISGPAVAGLAGRALETDFGQPGFLPARLTIDLLKPARQVPTRTQTRIIRDGRRVRYAECDVIQGDWIVARATAVFYRQSEAPAGQEWEPHAQFVGPQFVGPQRAEVDGLFVGSEATGWSVLGAEHQNTSRKQAYYRGPDVVAGEQASPFVRSVIVAEAATNMVINLGTEGIGYINGDVTVSLSRLPRSEFIGVRGETRSASAGVAVGTATLFDTAGPIGTAMVTALANPAAQIDFTSTPRTQAPGAELFSASRA